MPLILAIESSCDETSAAISKDGNILSNVIATQAIHQQYGGVVPELASRAHMQHIVPVVSEACNRAGVSLNDVDAFAFTQSPGLIGALMVGAQFAKSLALATGKPLIAVHHMQAHVLANLIEAPRPAFPFLCLTVSGGHTQIVVCHSPHSMEVIGETIDDAVGEAFDKTAKLLGLPYPGGPLIDKHAQLGNPKAYNFPEPKTEGLNFSFSGIKTAVLYFLSNAGKSYTFKEQFTATEEEKNAFIEQHLADICASVQYRLVHYLIKQLKKASDQTGIREVCIAGGVSANSGLRKALQEAGATYGWNTYIPAFQYCTDNAAMIAITAHYKFLAGDFAGMDVTPAARSQW